MLSLGFTIVLTMLLLSPQMTQEPGNASFQKTAILPCVITYSDDYWSWRQSLGKSFDIEEDMGALYEVFQRALKTNQRSKHPESPRASPTDLSETLCENEILFSSELTRILNSLGPEVLPSEYWASITTRIEKIDASNPVAPFDRQHFGSLTVEVICELGRRADSDN